jgi:hypothetical protein
LASENRKIEEGPWRVDQETERKTFKGECEMFIEHITGIHKWEFSISTVRRTQNVGGDVKC